MAIQLDQMLVVGIASSALFDLKDSDTYFNAHGEAAYRKYQDDRIDETLKPGVAFPFIRRLLALNELRPEDPLVEVIVLSRNDPSTGLRVMRSIEHHSLGITRAIFTQGKAPYPYMTELNMSLFLSADQKSVRDAVAAGLPAGQVLGTVADYADDDLEVRVAFDFDAVLADDGAERVYQERKLRGYLEHEATHRSEALDPGPLAPLLKDLNRIQDFELEHALDNPEHQPRLRISIVTARNAPAHERAIRSLEQWGLKVNDAFFMGGVEKSKVLRVLKPHVFFDDQVKHLTPAATDVASVHVPFGVVNALADPTVVSSSSSPKQPKVKECRCG